MGDLPASMPARFRHTAEMRSEIPRLTSGNNETLSRNKDPVVNLLLPSAALVGLVSSSKLTPGDSSADDPRHDVMQVSCQVLNVSPLFDMLMFPLFSHFKGCC